MTVRRRLIVVAAGLLVGGVMLLLAASPAARPGGGGEPTVAVAIGDSFISGEGGRWFGNSQNPLGDRDGTDRAASGCGRLEVGCRRDPRLVYGATQANGCHRSDVAPILSAVAALRSGAVRARGYESVMAGGSAEPPAAPLITEAVNLACSGAETRHLWRVSRGGRWFKGEAPQAERLTALARRAEVRLVVLTAIANDLGFADHVVACVKAWSTSLPARPRYCAGERQALVRAGLAAARAGLAKAVREVRAALAAAGQAPAGQTAPGGAGNGYRLLIMGYASPIPPGRWFRYPEWGWKRLTRGGCPFWDEDADWANEGITPMMSGAMRAVAAAEGAEYLDVQRALDGHQVCDRRALEVATEGPSEATSEWARRLIPGCCQGATQESLHPNAYGQRALGRCIALAYAEPAAPGGGWACRARPRQGIGAIGLGALP